MRIGKALKSLVRNGEASSGQILIPLMQKYLFRMDRESWENHEDSPLTKKMLEFQYTHVRRILSQMQSGSSRKHVGTKKFHPSSLMGCHRALWFRLMDAPSNAPYASEDSLRSFLIFSMGDMVHLRFQSLFHCMGILKQAEVPVEDEEQDLEGHCDAVVVVDGEEYAVEIKSINSNSFYTLSKGPKEEHLGQLVIYMDVLGISKGIILYEMKDRHELKEFHVDLSKQKGKVAEYRRTISRVRHFLPKKNAVVKMPDGSGTSVSSSACKWCRFTKVCYRQEEQTKFLRDLHRRLRHDEDKESSGETRTTLRIYKEKRGGETAKSARSFSSIREFAGGCLSRKDLDAGRRD